MPRNDAVSRYTSHFGGDITTLESIFNVINSLHSSIKFTLEKGNDCMPFLDVTVKITGDAFETILSIVKAHTLEFFSVSWLSHLPLGKKG